MCSCPVCRIYGWSSKFSAGEGSFQIDYFVKTLDLFDEDGVIMGVIDINFCPICGRKLGKESET